MGIGCDRCQKGENSLALEHSRTEGRGFSFNIGDAKHLCVCGRVKLPRKGCAQCNREIGYGSEKKL